MLIKIVKDGKGNKIIMSVCGTMVYGAFKENEDLKIYHWMRKNKAILRR